MDRNRGGDWWALLPPGVRRLPADLAAVLGVVLAVNLAVFLPVIRATPLRFLLGLPFVLFVPGYAFIAALFPEAGTAPTDGRDTERDESADEGTSAESAPTEKAAIAGTGSLVDRGIDGIERVALSFGLSIATVPLLGLVLNFTPWGIRLVPIMIATSGFTVGATWVAARRRWTLPPEERFRVPYRAWIGAARGELLSPQSRTGAALNVLLVVSILLAVSSVAYAVAVPKQGESFTEFYLLTEDEDGELVAADYPTEFVAGEGRDIAIGIGNQEHETVTYTVAVQLQRVELEPPDGRTNASAATANVTTVRVRETETLGQFEARLAHNETMTRQYTVRPTLVGENMRLAFLLYRGSPPPDPSVDNAYRETHLWVNVTAG
jgi:uncharacterized membrane protein